ncbi:cytochrome P450 [Streptomyces sp. NPDC090075]|uniref:cytochrome P450 n=1 Tax=Streptomyces sp. NPDC090075 TaxID=3365937 RepID=UPI0037FD643C
MPQADPFAQTVPDHIPPEMVREHPVSRGSTTTELPHDVLAQIQNGPEVYYAPTVPLGGGAWVFWRADHCRKIAMDAEHFSSKDQFPFSMLTGGEWRMIPAEIDPPSHLDYRKILNPLLSPAAIEALEDKVNEYARESVATFRARGHVEFMKEFALEYPVRIFLELMGLPLDRTEQFLAWEHGMIYAPTLQQVQTNTQAVVDYLRSEIDARRDAPGDDFIGRILRSDIDGRKLDDNELLGICFTLYIGGLDTVAAHLGHLVRHLAENQDDQAYLRENRDKIDDAIEELMRAYGATSVMRQCVGDTTVGGVTVKAGDRVLLLFSVAGRDPAEFSNPHDIQFDRKPRHVSFGYGRHLCMGMHLARRELRVAINTLFDMLPPFRIASDAEIVSDMGGMIQPQSLPLVWDV